MKESDYIRELIVENPLDVMEINDHNAMLRKIAGRIEYLEDSLMEIRGLIRPIIGNAAEILVQAS